MRCLHTLEAVSNEKGSDRLEQWDPHLHNVLSSKGFILESMPEI